MIVKLLNLEMSSNKKIKFLKVFIQEISLARSSRIRGLT